MAQGPIYDKLNGKVSADMSNLEGIYVINLKTEKAAITEKGGAFSIPAVPGDTLLFSAAQFKRIRIVLKQEDFEKELLFVKMMPIVNQLREVIVRRGYDNINAVATRDNSKRTKIYTPAWNANYIPQLILMLREIQMGRRAVHFRLIPYLIFFLEEPVCSKKNWKLRKKNLI